MSNIIIFLGMTNSNIQVAEFQMIIFLSKDLNTVKKKLIGMVKLIRQHFV